MNKIQKKILIVGVIILVIILLMPSWYVLNSNGHKRNYGYAFIAKPGGNFRRIDYGRLLLPVVVVITVTGAGIIIKKDE